MPDCVHCGKEYDYAFHFSLYQFHRPDATKDAYEKYEYAVPLCSKHCIASFVEKKVKVASHQHDTFIVDYTFPLGFCDKCGHATHPTEFCQQLGDYDEKTMDFHETHMAGQGSMVKMEGYMMDLFLGHGWLVAVQGVRYEADCVQLVKDLKARVPLAVMWNNEDALDEFLPSISIDGSMHTEIKDIFTDLHIKPSAAPEKKEGELLDRYFFVFQLITKVQGTRKLFFPYQLQMENCWFPVHGPQITRFKRYFFTNMKSPVFKLDKHEWTKDEEERYKIMDEPDEDCFEDFKKGMESLEKKEIVMQELNLSLKEIEEKMSTHVFVGQGRELVNKAEGDNVITEDDVEFLKEKGFDPKVLDELFLEQMKNMGVEGDLDEIQEEVKIVEKMMEEKKKEDDDVGEGKQYSKRIVLDRYCFKCEGKHHDEDCDAQIGTFSFAKEEETKEEDFPPIPLEGLDEWKEQEERKEKEMEDHDVDAPQEECIVCSA